MQCSACLVKVVFFIAEYCPEPITCRSSCGVPPGQYSGPQCSIVRADGGTALAASIVREFVKYEKKLRLLPWFGRVPSISNPADSASRLEFDTPWLQGANHLQLVLPDHMSQWGVNAGSPEAQDRPQQPESI